MPKRYYSEATAKKIRSCVNANPGIRAKEIGQRIGLTRSTVNSYLYSKKLKISNCSIGVGTY